MSSLQLVQNHLPVACDEYVYAIAREVHFSNPDKFENFVLILGTFHMENILLDCLIKYLICRCIVFRELWSITGPGCNRKNLKVAEYLVQISRRRSFCKSSDDLRLWLNHHRKDVDIETLLSTSRSVRIHLLRPYFRIYHQQHLLLIRRYVSLDS